VAHSGDLAEQLGHQLGQLRALADRVAMRAVAAGHVIVGRDGHAGARAAAFLAHRGVDAADELAAVDELLHGGVEHPDRHHAAVHLEQPGDPELVQYLLIHADAFLSPAAR